LQLKLFELPAVAEKARAAFSAQRLSQRAEVFGGDFLRERLPEGADIASLVRVLLDHDDTGALALLRAVRRALPHRGVLLIAEPMREAPGAQRMGAAYFGFYLLAMGRGRPRTPADIQILLDQSGFGRLRMIPTRVPLQTCVAVARAV
jgi:demethylspheroidene O-methyltransferase